MSSLRLLSWNVNGIRAAERKGLFSWLAARPADIVSLQETKARPDQLDTKFLHPDGYESYWNAAARPGYSGVVTYAAPSPLSAISNFGESALDGEGRIVMLEFPKFFHFNVYFPNGGQGPERLEYKLRFYDAFLELMESYRRRKPIVLCGDVNTAHFPIDLAKPAANAHHSGFLEIERKWLDKLIRHGYVDTFRHMHPEQIAYSWWDQKTRSRERNVGWRIDYFWVSEEIKKHLSSAEIHPEIMGSDHCPVSLELTF